MRKKKSLWMLVVVAVLVLGQYTYAGFFLKCNECDGSDSGTATGDGTGTVGTSNGSAGFDGLQPSFASLGVTTARRLRFLLNAPAPTLPSGPNQIECVPLVECEYDTINVNELRFFVSVVPLSPYCMRTPSPCATIASVRLGETFARDVERTVIFSAVIVGDGGIELDLDEDTKLHLTRRQSQALDKVVKAVRRIDPNDPQFFLGFAVSATALDPYPGDGVVTKIVPFSTVVTVDPFVKRNRRH